MVKVEDFYLCRWGSISGKSCSFLEVSSSKSLSLCFMCSVQHVNTGYLVGFPWLAVCYWITTLNHTYVQTYYTLFFSRTCPHHKPAKIICGSRRGHCFILKDRGSETESIVNSNSLPDRERVIPVTAHNADISNAIQSHVTISYWQHHYYLVYFICLTDYFMVGKLWEPLTTYSWW